MICMATNQDMSKRRMAELKRILFQKISDRIKREELLCDSSKELTLTSRINENDEPKYPKQGPAGGT
jgi:hypothetical protein